MKRNLAKDSLAAALDAYLSNEMGALDSNVLAEIALTHLESVVRMLPPKVRVEEVRKGQFMPDGEIGTFISWTYKSVWEPEDEKK